MIACFVREVKGEVRGVVSCRLWTPVGLVGSFRLCKRFACIVLSSLLTSHLCSQPGLIQTPGYKDSPTHSSSNCFFNSNYLMYPPKNDSDTHAVCDQSSTYRQVLSSCFCQSRMCSASINNRESTLYSIFLWIQKNRIYAESESCSIIVEGKSSISCNIFLQMEGFSFDIFIEGWRYILSSKIKFLLKYISHWGIFANAEHCHNFELLIPLSLYRILR